VFDVIHQPLLPRNGEKITVYARAQDPDDLSAVTLYYHIDGTTATNAVAMAPATGGFYAGEIPAGQTANSLIAFHVEATDNDEVSGKKTGVSKTQRLKIFSEAEHHRKIVQQIEKAWEKLITLLAEATGGLYIRRSADVGPCSGKIAEDLATYYEVAYAAPSAERNGQFRTVSLRASRPQTRLQYRGGYFALPAEAGPDMPPFEVPLLKALSAPERTETIPFRIDTLHLGQAQGKARAEAVLELPLAGIYCKLDPALGLCDMHFSVLVLVKDAAGQVLQKFSQDVPDQMATEGMDSASNGVYTLDRSFSLPPGEYHLEAIKDILCQKLVKRGVSLKNLTYGKLEPALGKSVRQKITLQQGIPIEKAKEIVRLVKDSKKKAQASIQGDTVRISSKDRDELQGIIALLRGKELGVELQFTNYRTN